MSSMARPATKVRLPSQSMRAGCRSPSSRNMSTAHTVAMMPTGTLMRNTQRQSMAANTPPRISPMNDPERPATMLIPRAMPRSS